MKKFKHILINLFWFVTYTTLLILVKKDFFTVSQRLYILDIIYILEVIIFIHLIYILLKEKPMKWKVLGALSCVLMLCIIFLFIGNFNPF